MKHDALGAMLLVMAVALTLTLIAIPGVDDAPMSPAARVTQPPAAPQVDEPAAATAAATESAPATMEPSASQPAAPETDTSAQTTAAADTAPATDMRADTQPEQAAVSSPASEPPDDPPTTPVAESTPATEPDSSRPAEVATAEPVMAEPVAAEQDPAAETATEPTSAGAKLYSEHCAQCHDGTQAPRLGDQQEWVNRFARGMDALKQFVTKDQTHQAVAAALSTDQIDETLTYMMAETFWPQSR